MSPTANIPPGCRTGKKMRAPAPRRRSSRLISVTGSSSERIWPVKQSFVSKTTVSPGSTSSTGSRSGPNDQITWSRDSRCCTCALRRERLVLDVHALHVAQPLGLPEPEEHRQDDAGRDPPD